ncbi:V-type proton ATPase subunit d1-like [Nylanderia fulva]|uniref:V-type proton ATPase subunit d1-like n=1 Tax=Nylanderia fulva TaxID=613905 RepID=UPI0010FB537B|nr:V-type proton ATPase subunit d1-like [Nylanderia fulva]
MNNDYLTTLKYGHIIAKIHGKSQVLLKESDYLALQQCDALDEVILKLQSFPYSKYLSEDMKFTKKEFTKRLTKSMIDEFTQLYLQNSKEDEELCDLLGYFINHYKIQNFIYLLASKQEDPDLGRSFENIEEIGRFNELNTLKFANDMVDVYKFCVESTFLKDYYHKIHIERDIHKNDFQILHSYLLKHHIDTFYEKCKRSSTLGYMKTILEFEGDRRIIEIVLNTLNNSEIVNKKRAEMFPNTSSMDLGIRKKLSSCTSVDELRGVLSTHPFYRKMVTVEDEEILNALVELEMRIYVTSFTVYNDLSCIYSYFKMKEQEVKNILWIIECILQERKEAMRSIIIPEKVSITN